MTLIYELILWLGPLIIGLYTITYAYWLWKKQNNLRGALGVAALAAIAALYPGFVLFFVHK